MHHHHDAEEQEFFPNIEKISKVPGLMERNVEQHRAFTPGFERFQEYAQTCRPAEYDGQKLKSLIEDFAEPLTKHLHDEIETLRALSKYDSEAVRQAYKRLEKLLMATDNVRITFSDLQEGLRVFADNLLATHRPSCIWDRGQKL